MLATDTPDMAARGDVRLGGGPGMSLYSFHGRGTLNGTIPHPALVALFDADGAAEGLTLQRSAHVGALTDSSYVQLVDAGRRRDRSRLSDALHPFGAGGLRPRRPRGLTRLLVAGIAADRRRLQPRPRRLRAMNHYLGIDIGTFASKGVLVDGDGRIVASADKPHKMIVPQPGWAEHRPREDWWDDFTYLSRKLLADSGVAPTDRSARSPAAPSARACCRSTRTASR